MAIKSRRGIPDGDFDEEIPGRAKSRDTSPFLLGALFSCCLLFVRMGLYLTFALIAAMVVIAAAFNLPAAVVTAVARGLEGFFDQLTGLFSLLASLAMLLGQILWLLSTGQPGSCLTRFFDSIPVLDRLWTMLSS